MAKHIQDSINSDLCGTQNTDDPSAKSASLQKLEDQNRALIEKMQQRLVHFEQAIEQGPVAVVITDAEGKIEFVNSKFELITGYSGSEVIGRNPRILRSGETPKQTYKDMWETILKGDLWTGVFHNRHKDGRLFWERAVISAVKGKDGNISHFVGVKEDITRELEITKNLEEEKLKYFHQSKMAEIGLLASSILHEVSNPIAAIRGLIAEIKESYEGNSEESCCCIQSNIDLVLEQTDHLTEITHEISDFTSPNAGELTLLDLNSIIRSVSRLVQFDKRWRNISLTLDCDSQLPAISGYKDQLSHLLINLLVNAADAVEETDNEVHRIVIRTSMSGDHAIVSVKDNGIGMTPIVQEHAFDAFYTTKKPGKGSGLGLSLCSSIIENHDGRIEIESTKGYGTTIRIMLPLTNDYSE